MATVYEAKDPQLHRSVALKVMHSSADRPDLVTRFHREAAIAAQLRHPHIVGIHEIGLVRGEGKDALHYIAMDLIEGDTLATVLQGKSVSRERLLGWLEEVARAAAYAHEKGVVHRDIKPANILIDKSGRALLADFGLARGAEFSAEITRSHAVLGTLGYMAPEQIEGKARDVDARADVYALGIVLYEILAGKRPFDLDRPNPGEEPQTPSRLDRSVPRELEVICLKAIDRSPEFRYGSALEMAEDLARFRRGEPIAARPLSPLLYLSRKIVRRRAIAIPVGVAVIACAAFTGWILHVRAERAQRLQEHLTRARVGETKGDFERARDAYRSVLALEPTHAVAAQGLTRMETHLSQREQQKRVRIRLEQEALQEIEEARTFLEQSIRQPGKRFDSQTASSLLQQALHFLESAVRKAPHLAAAHLHLGRAYALRNDPDRAVPELDRSIQLDSSLSQAFLERGKIRSKRREWKAAFADFSSALLLSPLMAEARTGRARVLEAQGDLAGALSDANELVRTHPYSVASYFLRSEILERAGKIDEAVQDCTASIRLDPHPGAYLRRGNLFKRQGKTAEALADYETALSLTPTKGSFRRSIERAVGELKSGRTQSRDFVRETSILVTP